MLNNLSPIESNAFAIIGATTRDDRKGIVELAEEKSFTGDAQLCTKARSDLTNPRNRLAAELGWMPGVSPKRAAELIIMVRETPMDLRKTKVSISPLAFANLLSSGLSFINEDYDAAVWSEWILDIADAAEKITPEETLRDINEDRTISGFPEIKGIDTIQTELSERMRSYNNEIKKSLDRLPPEKLLNIVTSVIKSATDNGNKHAPAIIDDVLDTYELHTKEFLESEARKVIAAVEVTKAAVSNNKSAINGLITKIDKLVRHWNKFALPIQLSKKSRGLWHDSSRQVAYTMRGLVIEFAEHEVLEAAAEVTNIIKEVFAELPELAEQALKDSEDLNKMVASRRLDLQIAPIIQICRVAMQSLQDRPKMADLNGQRLSDDAQRLLKKMQKQGMTEDAITYAKNHVATALFQCAITYGNASNKWHPCVKLLQTAKSMASDSDLIERINQNLETAIKNQNFGGLKTGSSAPTLWLFNFCGFTLYGASEFDSETNSQVSTYYFVILLVPIFPIARYRVIKNGNSYRFLGKLPLRAFNKCHLAVSLAIIAWIFLTNYK